MEQNNEDEDDGNDDDEDYEDDYNELQSFEKEGLNGQETTQYGKQKEKEQADEQPDLEQNVDELEMSIDVNECQ